MEEGIPKNNSACDLPDTAVVEWTVEETETITVVNTVVEEEDIVAVNEAIEAIVVTIEVEEGEAIVVALTMTVVIVEVATEVVLVTEAVSEEAHEGVTAEEIEVADTEALDLTVA